MCCSPRKWKQAEGGAEVSKRTRMPRFHSRKAKAKSSKRQLFCSGMSIQQICRASHQRRPKFVILQRMEVIFSHTTALDLLRIWSCNHPLALRAFHDLRSRDVGHLPSSHLKGFSSLAHAADTEAAVRAAIESAKRPSLKRMLEELSTFSRGRKRGAILRSAFASIRLRCLCHAEPFWRLLQVLPCAPRSSYLFRWPSPSLPVSSLPWAMSSAGATLWMQDGRVHLCGRSLQRQGDLLRSRSAPSALRGRRKRAPSFLSFARNQHR